MAYATINFKNPHAGTMKSAPVGFSWTTLFFSFFPALFRGHWAGVLLIIAVTLVTFGVGSLIFPFIYNKMYIKHLIGEGFIATSGSQDLEFLAGRLKMALPTA